MQLINARAEVVGGCDDDAFGDEGNSPFSNEDVNDAAGNEPPPKAPKDVGGSHTFKRTNESLSALVKSANALVTAMQPQKAAEVCPPHKYRPMPDMAGILFCEICGVAMKITFA